jgi:hypothetical protein
VHDFNILALTETWLNDNSELFDISNYNVYRKDRDCDLTGHVRGGGVLIAVDSKFNSSTVLV